MVYLYHYILRSKTSSLYNSFLPLSLASTNKMKPRTEVLASPNSNMVAPQDEDRENDWIQVQNQKSRQHARKKGQSQVNKFQPSCKHHTPPNSLIHLNISSDDDSTSNAYVLDGRVGGQSFLYTWLHCECCG